MRKISIVLIGVLTLLVAVACGAETGAQSDDVAANAGSADSDSDTDAAEGLSDDEKTLYAIGLMMSSNLGPLGLSEDELEQIWDGVKDGVAGTEPKVDLQAQAQQVQAFAQSRAMARVAEEKKAAQPFLDERAAAEGAEKTDSGLIFTETQSGEGASPAAADTVKVHYHGTLRDGTVFDSSVDRGEPVQFGLNQVIPCWTEGLQKMQVGGKATLVCPSDIAYGDGGRPPKIPGGATLVFDVELLEINPEAPTPPPTQ